MTKEKEEEGSEESRKSAQEAVKRGATDGAGETAVSLGCYSRLS
ncbi:hypothetical protein [Tunturiibacter lichenicola]